MKSSRRGPRLATTMGATFALVVSLLAIGSAQAADAADYATIAGAVTADDGGAPVVYPFVTLYKKSGSTWIFSQSTTGGKDGTYRFGFIADGTYTVEFAPKHGDDPATDNFVTEWWNNATSKANAQSIPISNVPGSVSHVTADAALATGAIVSGHVTLPSPDAVASFTPDPDIELIAPDTTGGYPGWKYAGLWAYPAEDGSGDYQIMGVPPGIYSVFFGDDASKSDYTPLFYKSGTTGTPDDWSASSFTVSGANDDKSGISATYRHGATATGKVTNYWGTAVSSVTVTFWRPTTVVINGVTQWQTWKASTGSAGTFRETGLPPGTKWQVQYSKSGYTTAWYPVSDTAYISLSGGALKTLPTVKLYKKLTSATPTISGTRKVGYKLTANHGTWTSGTSFSYAWYANGVYISGTSGATHSTFTLTSAQRGKTITVKVTGKKTGYTTVTRTSAPTAAIS